MSKTKEQLLLDYKKSNKERRLNILVKAGFTTEAEYITYLMQPGEATPEPVSGDKPTIHNVYIIDRSGSMAGAKLSNAIAGVNLEVSKLKEDNEANYTQTIVDFGDDVKTVIYKVPIADCGRYFTHTNGMTALYQAIGETLSKLRSDNKEGEKVLVKIFTDGGENSSRGTFAHAKDVAELIKQCESEGFTVTFVGTSFDVDSVIDKLKIDASNTLVHDNTAESVQRSFLVSTSATMDYVSNVRARKSVTKGFYKKLKD